MTIDEVIREAKKLSPASGACDPCRTSGRQPAGPKIVEICNEQGFTELVWLMPDGTLQPLRD
jgi:hypothetical protein